jgi:hypothetical protein
MRKLSMVALTILIVGTSTCGGTTAQTAPSTPGTRLITLGTLAGPTPRAHRAQSSNLLIVNGAFYVVDAGDGVAPD